MLKTLQLKKLRLGWKRLMCCLLFAIHSHVGKLFPGAILSSSGAVCVWEDAAGSCPSACCPLRTAVEWPWVEEAVCLSVSQAAFDLQPMPLPVEGGRKGLHGFCVLQSFSFSLWGCWISSVQWEHGEVRQKSSRKCQTQQDVSSWWLLSDLQKYKWHKLAFNSFSSTMLPVGHW